MNHYKDPKERWKDLADAIQNGDIWIGMSESPSKKTESPEAAVERIIKESQAIPPFHYG